MFGLQGFAHVLFLIGPTAVLGGGAFRCEGKIKLGLVEAILLEILKRLDGLLFDGMEVLGLSGVMNEFRLLLMGFVEEVLHFFHGNNKIR
jgi:hypothetical protein